MAATKPKRIAGDERRELIALAAGRLFAAKGYAGTRMEDVAAAADVTKPMVYRHFDSKKDLYLALLARHEDDLPSFFEGVDLSETGRSADSLVRAILEVWLDYVRTNAHAWAMLFRDNSGDEEIQAFRLRVSLSARQVMAAFIGQRAGSRMPPEQVEPTAELLTSGLAGLAMWWIDRPDVPKPVVVDVAARMSAPAVG
ncbi:MAG TPA: TetR/AcrR family transcriptional regulator [Thermoleophilaceae bacterium]|nr:TetR/AcrR family transcriptional regulator [Thermoleophilaceae bacterium]